MWLVGGGAPKESAPAAMEDLPLAHRAANVERAGSGSFRVVGQECGVFRLGRKASLESRLAQLAGELETLLARTKPGILALEEAFTGRSVQAALRVGEARGVILSQAGRAGVAVEQFAPARIKRVVAGHGSADKEAVAAMVGRMVGIDPKGVPADATDALAVALCGLEAQRAAPWQQPRGRA